MKKLSSLKSWVKRAPGKIKVIRRGKRLYAVPINGGDKKLKAKQ